MSLNSYPRNENLILNTAGLVSILLFLVALLYVLSRLFIPDLKAAECTNTQLIESGLTILEQVLIGAGVIGGTGGLFAFRVFRTTIKAILTSIDSNPLVSNDHIKQHAATDKRASKQLNKLPQSPAPEINWSSPGPAIKWSSPGPALKEAIEGIGACNCMTKTPDPKFHKDTCPVSKHKHYNPKNYRPKGQSK